MIEKNKKFSISQLLIIGIFIVLGLRFFSSGVSVVKLSSFETKQFMQSIGASEDQKLIIALVADWCPHCQHAENVLKQKNITYIKADIEKNAGAAEIYRQLSKRTGTGIPQFIIGTKAFVGFDEAEILKAIEKL